MPCFTRITVTIEDNEINRKAREALGLPITGRLSQQEAQAVKVEAGVIKARISIRRVSPGAVIRRTGNKLTVSVSVS